MSSTVRSYGVMGVIVSHKVEDFEELYEKLYDDKSNLGINGDQTLAYLDANANKEYSERENFYGLQFGLDPQVSAQALVDEAAKYGIVVDPKSCRMYQCIWYNGGDSDMDLLTLKEFGTQTLQMEYT